MATPTSVHRSRSRSKPFWRTSRPDATKHRPRPSGRRGVPAAERTARDAMVGKADPHALVQALSQSELAIETAVAVRDKVVEAYQEILRMPV